MIYGVKLVVTYSVGDADERFYEEMILKVTAESFDDAYKKAEEYVSIGFEDYINPNNETVKTMKTEILDCFLALDPEGDVQEVYSAFYKNRSTMDEHEYYETMTSQCDEYELYALRNIEFNSDGIK